MRLLLDRGGQFLVAQSAKPFGLRRRRDPDDAGAIAGQGHEHARTVRRVELGRDVAMGPRVADVESQRRLGQLAPRHRDAGGFAAKRMPAVGCATHRSNGGAPTRPGRGGEKKCARGGWWVPKTSWFSMTTVSASSSKR